LPLVRLSGAVHHEADPTGVATMDPQLRLREIRAAAELELPGASLGEACTTATCSAGIGPPDSCVPPPATARDGSGRRAARAPPLRHHQLHR
jgi:hypothetical protein